jgi:hypothetical protein
MLELALATGRPLAELEALDPSELSTLVAVLEERGARAG